MRWERWRSSRPRSSSRRSPSSPGTSTPPHGRTSSASAALELAYFGLLASAYERADLSFVYPIAAAAPVLVLIVVARRARRRRLGRRGGRRAGGRRRRAARCAASGGSAARGGLLLALGVAACIAAYTLVDDEGVRHAAALSYFEAVLLITAPLCAAAVAFARGPAALRIAATPRSAAAGLAMFAPTR